MPAEKSTGIDEPTLSQAVRLSAYKAGFGILVLVIGLNTYSGWAASDEYVNKEQYKQDRQADKEARQRVDKALENILKSVQQTEKEVAVLGGKKEERDRLQRAQRSSSYDDQ